MLSLPNPSLEVDEEQELYKFVTLSVPYDILLNQLGEKGLLELKNDLGEITSGEVHYYVIIGSRNKLKSLAI